MCCFFKHGFGGICAVKLADGIPLASIFLFFIHWQTWSSLLKDLVMILEFRNWSDDLSPQAELLAEKKKSLTPKRKV